MPQKVAYCLQKRRYAQISVKKRLEMVKMVEIDGRSYSDAARRLHANPSTVRLIIKKYKDTGIIFMKKLRNATKVEPQPIKVETSPVLVKVQATENDEFQEDLLKQEQKKCENVKIEPTIKSEEPIFTFNDQLQYRF